MREKKITCPVLWQNSVLTQQSSPGWDVLRINIWQVGNVFYELRPHGWQNPGSTGSISEQCEVVRLWWGSEPSFTLLLSRKGEVPMGREQLVGRYVPYTQAPLCSAHTFEPLCLGPSRKRRLSLAPGADCHRAQQGNKMHLSCLDIPYPQSEQQPSRHSSCAPILSQHLFGTSGERR